MSSSWAGYPPANNCPISCTCALAGDRPTCTSILEPGCYPPDAQLDQPCQDWAWDCKLSPNSQQYYIGLSVSIAGLVIIMLLLYFVFMHIAGRELAKLPYSKYRVPNLAVKFQAGGLHELVGACILPHARIP